MSHLSSAQPMPLPIEAGQQVARLRSLLLMVEQMAGRPGQFAGDAVLDEGARFSGAYAQALPVMQRRFEALAGETAAWATAGVEALLAHQAAAEPPRAAAARLALELDRALAELGRTLRA